MKKISEFKGVRTLITGASSGFGRILSIELAKRGARLVLVARREEELKVLQKEVENIGAEAICISCDVAELEQVQLCVQQALKHYGNIDMLINNAGYGGHRPFLDWPIEDIERMMRVNYFGSVYFAKLLIPQMVEMKNGCVVFIGSVAGKLSTPDESVYCASKHAVCGLADALSIEVEDQGVYVTTINPGAFDTPFFKKEDLIRMPPIAKNSMGDPNKLVKKLFKTLAQGKHELIYPWFPTSGTWVRAIAPEFMRKQVKKVTFNKLPT